MRNDTKNGEKSQIENNDGWNRVLYGSPTIGGFIVVGLIIAFIIFNILSK